jgi:Bacterial PH domain
MKRYDAHWGKSLIIVSTLSTMLLIGIAFFVAWISPGQFSWVALLPLTILLGSALFTIRGYTVTTNAILVQRLFWETRLPLADLRSVQFKPNAMCRSLRTFGNGGLFSFTGFYRNKELGNYRAFVTNLRNTVVLHFSDRTIVVSPVAPEDFIENLPMPDN